MGSDYGPPPNPFLEGLQAGQVFTSARERRDRVRQDREDRDRDFQLRQQSLAAELESRASADRARREESALRRADLATKGVRFNAQPQDVMDPTGSTTTLPSLTGVGSTTFQGQRLKPGVTAVGDGGYYNPDWSAAAADDRRTQAARDAARGRRDAALRAGGYNDVDRGLVEDAGVDPKDVGPLAAQLEQRARRLARTRQNDDPEAALTRRRVNAEALLSDYDKQTQQGLDYAHSLKVPDFPVTAADSALGRTRDSTLNVVRGRIARRPSLDAVLGGGPPNPGPTKTWQQRRQELLNAGTSEPDIEKTLIQEGYISQ